LWGNVEVNLVNITQVESVPQGCSWLQCEEWWT